MYSALAGACTWIIRENDRKCKERAGELDGQSNNRREVRDMDRKKEAPAEKGQEPVELGPGILIVLNAR